MIIVRNSRVEDAQVLVDIGMRAWEQAATGVTALDSLRDNARNAFLTFLSRHWLTVTVAEKAGVVVGWVAREALDDQITDLWVEPAHQRQGVGTALLAAVEAEVRDADYESVGLQTHARNTAALSFFGKHGYSVHWLSIAYSHRLERDVESVGLSRQLVVDEPIGYGPGGF